MRGIHFLISNDRHHVAAAEPIIRALESRGRAVCSVASLCEFRGMQTPSERLCVPLERIHLLAPRNIRRSTGSGRSSPHRLARLVRSLARRFAWSLVLKRRVRRWLDTGPDAVVVPNDTAFPFDRIGRELRRRSIPFILLQEGIRFDLPQAAYEGVYGRGGAALLAVWGEGSARHFERIGVPRERIRITGSPRFHGLFEEEPEAPAKDTGRRRRASGSGGWTLLFLSNPIDDQGFCTSAGKDEVIERFLEGVQPLLAEDPASRLILKLHSREDPSPFQRMVERLEHGDQVALAEGSLEDLFDAADAAVVMASSTGMEALMSGVHLGVLELPGHGFAFDYVQQGVALGLSWDRPMASQVRRLLEPGGGVPAGERSRYLRYHLAPASLATERLAGLCLEVANGGRRSTE